MHPASALGWCNMSMESRGIYSPWIASHVNSQVGQSLNFEFNPTYCISFSITFEFSISLIVNYTYTSRCITLTLIGCLKI